jgi:hypothetical protein
MLSTLANSLGRILFMVALLSLTGCLHRPLDSSYSGPKRGLEVVKYERGNSSFEESVVEKTNNYVRKEIRFENGEGGTQMLTYFDVATSNKSPVIVISPAMGGSYWIEKRIARYFAGRGFPSVIVHRVKGKYDTNKEPAVADLDRALEVRMREHQRALDWIATQPLLDAQKVGVIGISKGAIDTTLLLAHDSRVNSAVLVLAAGSLPYVLAYSREPHLEKQRRIILDRLKLNEEELCQKFEREMVWNPIKFADCIDARSVLMILAGCDTIVPYKSGLELRKAIGNPETYVLPTGHITSYLLKGYIQRKALDFFERKFKEPKSEIAGRTASGREPVPLTR